MEERKELRVSAIKNGTVIDHISASVLFKVISILELKRIDTQMSFGTNLDSKRLGKKGIIKIADKYPDATDMNKIALIAPEAKINIIKDYKVVEKTSVKTPEKIGKIFKCFNPKCVTNFENVTTKFDVIKVKGQLSLKCHYCEKITEQEDFKIVH
jgi:aspartate carbamoyltransferase regulatory subunit